ncbi:ABC-F family ATP-binding cassette domain-containing protein [bacterium]|nr:ABC-F family ATP-binding cassette domain-containing protein [bacterium]MCB2179135.1 ABC-F family ATP-binding cassette domain-containing protein [bacterium]
MAVLTATNLSKSYPPDLIFSGVSLSIPQRARVAIVGPNGIGKTTLLRILAGEESPDNGSVHLSRSARMGYLPQEVRHLEGETLWDECLAGLAEVRAQETRLKDMEKEMAERPDDQDLLATYGRLQELFELAGGYTYETRISQVLTGLGFQEDEYQMPLAHLSGGQRTRAWLARLLLASPDLLILDEPTNHLDIQAVEWLESYLRDWDGAALIVSHDRFFLDQVVTHIYEMTGNGFETYRGNYTHYVHQREERWEERRQFYASELARMYKELGYIKKNIAGQRVQMAKGKLSRLSRDIEAVEKLGFDAVRGKQWARVADEAGGINRKPMRVEEAESRLSALRVPDNHLQSIKLHIRPQHRSGNIVLRAEDLKVGYPGNPLFHVDELELRRQECVALIGPNGSGKTTFLRTLMGETEPLGGELRTGASLKIGYFAQAHEELDPNRTLIEEIDRVGNGMMEKDIRKYLGRFLFSGDDQYKKISVLSGGERGRMALAKLALLDANFLLLDEPSNHLDIPGQEVLQQVLTDFDGTILLVSHDRYLIDALASQIWDIDKETGELTVFKGNFKQYKGLQEERPQKETESETEDIPSQETASQAAPTLSKHQRQRIQNQIDKLEDRILALENRLEDVSTQLQNPPNDSEAIKQLGEDYAYLEAELQACMDEWEAQHILMGEGVSE